MTDLRTVTRLVVCSMLALSLLTAFEAALTGSPARSVLCAVVAPLYLLAGLGLAVPRSGAHRLAALACGADLFCLLMAGAVGLALPGAVAALGPWADYGSSYAYLPVLVPLAGLAVLLADPGGERPYHRPAPQGEVW